MICRICKKNRKTSSFYTRNDSGKKRTECKFCMQCKAKNWYKENYGDKLKNGSLKRKNKWKRTPKGIANRYKANAKKRKINFELNEDFIIKITKSNCHYCGTNLLENKNPPGIDRMNPSVGYIEENCVPCCWDCNKMKQDFSYEHFIKKCKLIYERKFK